MAISIWRYGHLLLAISSSIFILIASVTGTILAVESIFDSSKPYHISGASDLSIAQVISNLDGKYDEVLNITHDSKGFVSVSVIENGESKKFYVDPFNGEKIGELEEKAPIYQFATTLHRSLFLKSTGRFFIGLVSFLLILISITGIVLIIKRQGGIRRFFKRVVNENFFQYTHTITSRVMLIPILIIAISGVYLSLLRFDIIPDPTLSLVPDEDKLTFSEQIPFGEFDIFENTKLSELRELEFPFSPFEEDYFLLKLDKKEVLVNQFNGEILGEQAYPFVAIANSWASVAHTGIGSITWSIVLGLGSLAIPFLMYSGFVIGLKRPKTKIKNTFKRKESKFVILVGTENGTTFQFANMLFKELIKANQPTYLGFMNDFKNHGKMEHLIVITATYGKGEAPASAENFVSRFSKYAPKKPFTFSVVGFGSSAYPDFCQFAYETDRLINSHEKSTRLLDVHTVNNHSFESFNHWASQWSQALSIPIRLEKPEISMVGRHATPLHSIEVLHKSPTIDDTFYLELKIPAREKCQSGDLLAVRPEGCTVERLYSIGIMDQKSMLICVKIHEHGICSNYLDGLNVGDKLDCRIEKNQTFHFPLTAKKVVMISTGTGIGPFLGMMENNRKSCDLHLFWGGKNKEAFGLYEKKIFEGILSNKLTKFAPAYSREQEEKIYVQHLLEKDPAVVVETLNNKGVIMICGSVMMQKSVNDVIRNICTNELKKDFSHFQNKGQILMDCY